ncbi:PREDICTED: uncharacterized protein LOC108565890 isoform X2 [Nicrophorus vespilloides]|nr:PREDICTED: uncharacterized protein LOC108565890 isoform X2 [Nicrophorus vespilloides]
MTTKLDCPSNDEDHSFMFWKLAHGAAIIGPGNDYDKIKFDYEILTGKLLIRKAVAGKDDGLYECVSRGVHDDEIQIRTVHLIIRKDWNHVFEHDQSVNYFRIAVISGTIFILIVVFFMVYRNLSKRKSRNYLEQYDDEEEDIVSDIEDFNAPGPSNLGNIVLKEKRPIEKLNSGFENPTLTTTVLINTTQ